MGGRNPDRLQTRADLGLLAAMVESANDAIIGLMSGRTIVTWNPGAEKLFGYSSEEALGQDISIIRPSDGDYEVDRLVTEAQAGRPVDQFETVRQRKDGSLVDVSINISPTRDEAGKIIGVVEIIRDITRRKRAEEQINLLQTLTIEVASSSDISSALEIVLRRVCERTGWAIGQAWRPSADGKTLDCDPAWFSSESELQEFRSLSEEMSFTPGVGIPGRVWSLRQPIWIQDVTLDDNFPRIETARKSGLKAALGVPIFSDEGVTAVIEFFVREPRKEDERLVKVISSVAAGLGLVFARKKIEDSVLRERNFSNITIDSLPGVFYHYDDQGRFLRWNKNFEHVTGYSTEEIANLHPLDFFAGDEKAFVQERILEVFTLGKSSVEANFVCKDGRMIPYFFTGHRVDIDGRPYLVGMGIDISERKYAEEALRRSQAELAHVSRVTTMGELAASIAHEINQPLGAIVGNADICMHWLKAENPDLDELREALSDIISDGHRATAVISRVRSLARKSPPQKTELDLNEVVIEVLALIGHEAQTKGVAIRSEQNGDAPIVHGDRVQLQQVLINLLMNGMDAMSDVVEGERKLAVFTRRVDGGAVVAVEDSGIGINSGEADKLFKAFHTTKANGMGMGLAISKSIIEAHGGRLWATANDGPGATFQFTLPAIGSSTE